MLETPAITVEQDEQMLRARLGRRVKSADARAATGGMLQHRGVLDSRRPAGDYERDLHERVIIEKAAKAKEHHEEHENHRGRCCQVAVLVNPRPSDPPVPPHVMSKAEGAFSFDFSSHAAKVSAHANPEIFRFEPGSPEESTIFRARSVPPQPSAAAAAGASATMLSSRGKFRWQMSQDSFPNGISPPASPGVSMTMHGSPRAEYINNSAQFSSAHDIHAAERRAQSERRVRLQEDEPFKALCAQAVETSAQTKFDREVFKSKMRGSGGVASAFVWG